MQTLTMSYLIRLGLLGQTNWCSQKDRKPYASTSRHGVRRGTTVSATFCNFGHWERRTSRRRKGQRISTEYQKTLNSEPSVTVTPEWLCRARQPLARVLPVGPVRETQARERSVRPFSSRLSLGVRWLLEVYEYSIGARITGIWPLRSCKSVALKLFAFGGNRICTPRRTR